MTLFEEQSMENASILVDLLRTELERAGAPEQAIKLRGLDVLTEESLALAELTVESIPSGLVPDLRRYALEALRQAQTKSCCAN